jgi:hypothetical protein
LLHSDLVALTRTSIATRLLLAGTLFCSVIRLGLCQNLVVNGNFEVGPFDLNGTISNWSVSGNNQIAETTEGGTDGPHSATFDVGGDYSGSVISQDLNTAAGQWYVLDFDSGIYGQRSGSPLQLSLQISGGPNQISYLVTPPETHSPVSFHHYRFTFIAGSANTTLQFSDVGLGNANADVLLDAVTVQPTPAPAAGPLPLVNGTFESSPFDSNGSIAGWSVGGAGDLAASAEGATSGSHAAVFSIGQDSESSTLSQTFATSAGQDYNLDFDAGVFGVHSGGPLQFRARIYDSTTGASLLDQTVVPPEAGTLNPDAVTFNHYRFSFNATSMSTTLEFSDVGTGAGGADIVLDTVSVAIPTPTPIPTPSPPPTPTPSPTPMPTPTTLPLNNSSFEVSPFAQIGTISGWTVSGHMHVAALPEGATDGTHSAAFSAGDDSQGNVLSQSFVTSPGQTYNIDFDAGVYGITDSTLQLQVKVLGSALSQTIAPPYSATSDPSHVQFQHFHYTFAADGSVATVQFTDFLLGNQNADIVLDQVSIVPQPPTYTEWCNTHFTQDQRADLTVSGWAADPDHDGFQNGLEYFSHTDPLAGIPAADSRAIPVVSVQTNGSSRYLTFAFRRLLGWSGNPPVVAISDNLSTWDITGNQIESVGNPIPVGDGITETVTVRVKTPINSSMPRKFVRLQLTQ